MTPASRDAGQGFLGVEFISGQSAATRVFATSPLRILVPRPRGCSVWACLSSLGGGLVAGDEISLSLDLGDLTRCFLTTQASTKIYRNPDGRPCGHDLRARLGPGSLLVLAPDPVQAFEGSSYCQRQHFSLAPESGLVFVDWLTSGRSARGERWAFRRFQSRTEIRIGESRALLDSLLLDQADGPLDDLYRMGRFNCLALVILAGQPLRPLATRLLEELGRLPCARRAPLVCAASPINSGALIRLAGESVEAVGAEIHRLLDFLPRFLNENPWKRKW